MEMNMETDMETELKGRIKGMEPVCYPRTREKLKEELKPVLRILSAVLPVLFISVIFLLTGCAEGKAAPAGETGTGVKGGGTPGNELNVALTFLPGTMDPQLNTDAGTGQYLTPCCGTLYRVDEKEGIVEEFAESYEMSEDGLTYTIRLRDGLRYSNGDRITAKDFVYAFRRIADPREASTSIFLIQDICQVENVREVNNGLMNVERLGVSAPDDRTFVVKLSKPCPFIFYVLAKQATAPCNEEFKEQCGGNYALSPETILSSGPFMVDRYEPMGMQVHYSPNPYYIDSDKVKLSGMTFRQVANTQQAVMAYETGEADAIMIEGDYLDISEGDPCLKEKTSGGIHYFQGNFDSSQAWRNRNIRLALAKSIDRESIVRNFLKSSAQPLTRVIPREFALEPDGSDFGRDVDRYEETCGYDPEAARMYWEKGLKELSVSELTVTITARASFTQFFEIIKDQVERNLPGMKLELNLVSNSQFFEIMAKRDFEIIVLGWAADYPDPNSMLSLWCSGSNENYGNNKNERYDSLIAESSVENDPVKRTELQHQAETEVMTDLTIIPLYSEGTCWLVSENLENLNIDFTGIPIDFNFAVKKSGGSYIQ